MVRYKDGTPARTPLAPMFLKPITDLSRGCRRIAKLSTDDRLMRNRFILSHQYLRDVRTAHAQLTEFLVFLEKANRGE